MENSNLNNLPPFYIGETVEYITGKNMPKGTHVIVTGIKREGCGCWTISFKDNPFFDDGLGNELVKCACCKKKFRNSNELCGWFSTSFSPIKKQSFPLISLSKVIEKEKQLVSAN